MKKMKKMKKIFMAFVFILACSGWAGAAERPRVSVKLFPTINRTDFQVWESKFYPHSVLEQRMTEYLASLFLDYPLVDVEVLGATEMNAWLNSPHRDGDIAAQMEIYRARLKTRDNLLGAFDSGTVALRVKIFDAVKGEKFDESSVQGKDKRYTFSPSDEQLYYLNMMVGLPIPFAEGIDLLGLLKTKEKGQKMSAPTWNQFYDTSAWQAFMNATRSAHAQIMSQVNTALKRNGRELEQEFTGTFANVGKLISPTAKSTRKRREYILSIGEQDAVRVGDVLEVVRPDTYVTVDAEKPVVVIPSVIGKVKVTWTQANEAIVVVVSEKRKSDPIQLNDLAIKKVGKL